MSEIATSLESSITQASKRAMRNPWVLGWIAMVVIVLGVNIAMVTLAITTNPGLVTKDYYERGQDYEQHMASRRAERAKLGWQLDLKQPAASLIDQPGAYRFTALDAKGKPLAGAQVVLYAYRPSNAGNDFSVPMTEAAPGVYQANVAFPLKGVWDLIVNVKRDGHDYDVPQRIHVASR
jgi:nitrogen fixation protein FixH